MPNPKKKHKKKPENPVLKVFKDISEDTTKKIKKGIEDISKTVEDTIKNIQVDFEKQRIKKLKQDPAIKKLQKETIKKADKKAKKKLKKVEAIAEKALEDAEKSRMEAEQTRIENRELKVKLNNLESQNKKITLLLSELNDDFSEIKEDISKVKEEKLYLVILILEFEKRIREFIKTELINLYDGQWWENGIPNSVQKNVEGRIKKINLKKVIDRMKFLYYSDYSLIIVYNNNWKQKFHDIFHNKKYVESRMEIITKSRNCLFHGNEINEDIEQLKSYLKDLNKKINIT